MDRGHYDVTREFHDPMVDYVQPDFLIIGAAKAATTWLQRCLQQQPAVFMPDLETHYFSREYHRGAAWYNSFFVDAVEGALIGEKSNSYFDQPEAMRRIKEHVPEARLILQLRNPIERAYSDYCMLYRRGEVGPRIESYFKPGGRFSNRFLEGGRYSHHLDHIDRLFPAEQVLIVVYDDVQQQPAEHLETVRDFLGLNALTPIKTRIKDKSKAGVPIWTKRLFKNIEPALAPYRKQPWFIQAKKLIAREPRYPVLTPDLYTRLRDYYAEDVQSLAKRMNRDLTAWLADPSRGGAG